MFETVINSQSVSLLSSDSSDESDIVSANEKNNNGDYDGVMAYLQNIQQNIISQRTNILKKYVYKLLAEYEGKLTDEEPTSNEISDEESTLDEISNEEPTLDEISNEESTLDEISNEEP